MKHNTLITVAIFTFCLCATFLGVAQNISVTSAVGQSPNTLINERLAGDGVFLSNGKFNNSQSNIQTAQIGTFNRSGFTTFPFQSGIIMTTGNVNVAPGPNDSGSSSQPISPIYTDSQMSSIASGTITNCSVLDFDFVALADTFAFDYIFASEEYPEFVCSSFNDAFAFFLTGPDPVTLATTTRNIAIIPNSITAAAPNGIPVTINSVNPGSAGGSGGGSGCYYQYSQYYVANSSGSNGIQYDGYTTALTAQAGIWACQTYHMHLAVCNVGDNAYDSGVFLKEGSFYSPSMEIIKNFNIPEHGDTLIQNCRDLNLDFTLERPNRTGYSTYITFSGDAINGTDYTMTTEDGTILNNNNNSFSFQNDTLVSTHIEVLPGANFTNTDLKTIILYIENVFCEFMEGGSTFDTIILYLKANDSIFLQSSSTAACHVCEQVMLNLERGTGPLLYEWTPAIGIDNPNALISTAHITENRNYTLIARDRYGCLSDTATLEVTIHELPEASPIVTPEYGCAPLTISLQQNGVPNNSTIAWNLTSETDSVIVPDSANNVQITLTEPGYYRLYEWISTAPGCNDSIIVANAIHVSDYPHADFTFAPDEAQNGQEVLFYNQSTGDNINNYIWSFGDGSSSPEENPTHAYHLVNSDNMLVRLTVTNRDGCSDDTTQVVPVVDNFAFWVPNAFTPNNDGNNDIFLPRVNDVASYSFEIYSRNGELFFATHNTEQGWDGTVDGKLVPTGIYVWKIQYTKYSNPNKPLMHTGTVNLIR